MSERTEKPIVVFCDFDGTITQRDMIISIMEEFAPDGWESVKDDILSRRIQVQEGVGKLFSMIPSENRDRMIDYAEQNANIRNGFTEFLRYCKEAGITFLVTSGGVDFFVKPILAPYDDSDQIEQIYCNESDFSGETIQILWPYTCDEHCDGGCGLCKPAILRRYPAESYRRVVIGDSLTDLKAARMADHVIARAFLLDCCKEESLSHSAFTNFYDVIEILSSIQKEEVPQ